MDTVIMRFSWLSAAQSLNDAQFVNKVALYGFSECQEEVTSDDAVVNAMLEMVKPSVRKSVGNFLNKPY